MSERIHALAQYLTGKETLEDCSLDEIKHIAKRHPYFSPAQFLLLQKLRQLNSDEAEEQYKKSVLFYHDPLAFEYFISSERFYVQDNNLTDSPTTEIQEPAVAAGLSPLIQTDEEIPTDIAGEVSNPVEAAAPIETREETAEISIEFDEPGTENFEKDVPVVEEVALPIAESPVVSINQESSGEEVVENRTEENPVLPSLNDAASPSSGSGEIVFEPFHTVDYFASQGIRISQEELPKDKLGKQLKSFTEWLKTMKRLPATQIIERGETVAEKTVETMADSSVSESEVLTEAMAEVWAKQGNREKAIETYNKLSLLNPSKRAYFAAKIENLKHN